MRGTTRSRCRSGDRSRRPRRTSRCSTVIRNPSRPISSRNSPRSIPFNRRSVTRGSDEGIDLLLRTFCRAAQDAILFTPPTYGMYVVAAGIQGARTVTVPLIREKNFALDAAAVLKAVGPEVKLVFLCSPNNPTGGLLDRAAVLSVVKALATRAVVTTMALP